MPLEAVDAPYLDVLVGALLGEAVSIAAEAANRESRLPNVFGDRIVGLGNGAAAGGCRVRDELPDAGSTASS